MNPEILTGPCSQREQTVQLNKLSEDFIQVRGHYEGITLRGIAFKVTVPGNQKKVWHYNLTLLRGPIRMVFTSHEREGTMTTEKFLLNRIERSFEAFATYKEPSMKVAL